MKARRKAARMLERGLLFLGSLLLATFVLAQAHRFIMLRAEMAQFEASKLQSGADHRSGTEAGGNVTEDDAKQHGPAAQNAEFSLWSIPRVQAYLSTLSKPVAPLAVLRIPKLDLQVPVLEGTDKFTLNRGVGWIAGTALPGEDGNIGIAGHRDGFFRGLKDIRSGDTIELVTTSGTDIYVVDKIRITSPSNLSVLRPGTGRSLTLVTCYPFYFVGPAPRRYIVEAVLQK